MSKNAEIETAIEILLDHSSHIKELRAENSLLQQFFSERKVRNIHHRKTNLPTHIKIVVCSKFEIKKEISGLALVVYADSSSNSPFFVLRHFFGKSRVELIGSLLGQALE